MAEDYDFIGDLKSVMIHLIKHDQALYKEFMDIIEVVDSGQWARLDKAEKKTRLVELRSKIALLDDYYGNYPHGWSRQRYEDFKRSFAAYEQELGG